MIQIPKTTLVVALIVTAFLGGMIGYAVGLWHTKKILLGNLKAVMAEGALKAD